jgi:predicted adenylyl cyclase CyaB
MIEVEKKFPLTKAQEVRLLEDATLVEERTNVDIFYDSPDYRLSLDDTWLRQRNGSWELKKRLHPLGRTATGTVYDEIEDEERIRQTLNLDKDLPMAEAVQQAGLRQFARIEKKRRSYQHGEFHIDLDVCDFGYELGEIELLVDHHSKTKEALDKITTFAKTFDLDQNEPHAKVIEYLYRLCPDHYKALLDAGVI